mmetsp:Transcript_15177/g.49384  ORF Transcript_15177/g.49384 Transcript_15177/m.49384 type:complete len:265 (-) Transcript_15177:593-1387(-)
MGAYGGLRRFELDGGGAADPRGVHAADAGFVPRGERGVPGVAVPRRRRGLWAVAGQRAPAPHRHRRPGPPGPRRPGAVQVLHRLATEPRLEGQSAPGGSRPQVRRRLRPRLRSRRRTSRRRHLRLTRAPGILPRLHLHPRPTPLASGLLPRPRRGPPDPTDPRRRLHRQLAIRPPPNGRRCRSPRLRQRRHRLTDRRWPTPGSSHRPSDRPAQQDRPSPGCWCSPATTRSPTTTIIIIIPASITTASSSSFRGSSFFELERARD